MIFGRLKKDGEVLAEMEDWAWKGDKRLVDYLNRFFSGRVVFPMATVSPVGLVHIREAAKDLGCDFEYDLPTAKPAEIDGEPVIY